MMMSFTMESHIKSMKRIMKYVVTTTDRVILSKPNSFWDGRRYFLSDVTGMSNSDYAKYNSKKSVGGWYTFLNGEATSFRRKLVPVISLLVMEDELFLAVVFTQDILFVMRIINSMGFKVKLPMKL